MDAAGRTHATNETLEKPRILKGIQVDDRVAGSPRHGLTTSGKGTISMTMKRAIEAAPVGATEALTKRILKIQQFGWRARFHMQGGAVGV
jgi:hypothetical protein